MVQETATCFYCENMKTTFSCAESFIDLLAHTQDFGKCDQSQSSPTTGRSGGSMTGKPEQPADWLFFRPVSVGGADRTTPIRCNQT